jgi:small subunit ribosomal protein S16
MRAVPFREAQFEQPSEERFVAVKLRLMRMGKKKQPTYRVVAADARAPRDGRFIEIVGTYDPRQEPSLILIDNDKAVDWLRKGAQPTDRVEKLLKISGAWDAYTGAPASPSAAAAPRTVTRAASAVAADVAEAPPAMAEEAGPYGPGSAAPLADGAAPEGFTIKGNVDSMLYHTPASRSYSRTVAEVWFDTVEAAEAAGFSAPGGANAGADEEPAEDADA